MAKKKKKRETVGIIKLDGTIDKSTQTKQKKQREVVGSISSDGVITKYNDINKVISSPQKTVNNSNLSNNPFRQTTVNIPTLAPIVNNNLLNQGHKTLINQALQENISNKTKSDALNQYSKQSDLKSRNIDKTTPVTKESIKNKKFYNTPAPEKNMKSTLANSAKLLLKGNLKPFENAADSIISSILGTHNPVSYLAAGNSVGDFIEDTFGGKDEVKYTRDEKNALNKKNALDEQNQINKGLAMIGRNELMRNDVKLTDKDKLNLASARVKELQGADDSKEKWKNFKKSVNKNIAKDTTGEFSENIYKKAFGNDLNEKSYITDDSFGGKAINTIGQGFSQFLMSYATGSLGGASSSKLAKRTLEMAPVAVSGYGSGLEEAYNITDDEKKAQMYALGSATIEVLTEAITGSIPGLGENSGIDYIANKGINKISNRATRELTRMGYRINGEGFEEGLANVLDTYLKQKTIDPNAKLDWSSVAEDYMMGAISAGTIELPTNIANTRVAIREQNAKNQLKKDITPENAQSKVEELIEKGYDPKISREMVNESLKETNQTPINFNDETIDKNNIEKTPTQISIENVDQNETVQQDNTNTPQILQEMRQNQELSNKTINNSQNTQYSQIENNKKKIAPVIIKYEKSDNQKINNYRQSAIREGLYDNEKTRSLMNVSEKLIQEKGYNIVFDRTITNEKGQPVNAQIKPLDNGEIEIRVNPNSERAGEFLLIHEVSHAIKTQDMIDYVNKFASKNKTFAESVKSLEQQYDKDLTSEEVFADVCGQLFGNQEFIDSLVMENTPQSKSVIKKVYESIKRLLNNFTTEGRYKNFVQDLETKWREVYRKTSTKQAISNLNNETKYAQKTLKDGTYYIETEKNLFTKEDGTAMNQREIYNSLVGKQITFNDGIIATIKQWLPNNKNMYNELFKRYPNYKNVNDIKGVNKNINENIVELLENSNNVSPNEPDYMNRHKDNKINSFDTRKVSFFDGKNAYDLDFSIAKMQDGNYVAYAKKNLSANNELLNKIKKEAPTSKSRGVLPYADNISQNSNNVKSDISSTKYSMQESTNNTQELDNSSFSYDNQGRTLTKEQQEFFKDSKVRDEQGNLKVLYHGTPYNFTKFSYDKLGTNGTLLGKGFYLTDDINVAKAYANKGETGKVMELYADIKKPLKWGETSISKQQFQKFVEAINQATDGRLFADYSGEFSEKGSKQYTSTLNDILMDYEYGGDDIDLVSGILNTTGMPWDKGYKILNDTTGYDGIIVTTDVYDSGEGNVYIPFQSNQIKNVDNTNPTLNEDIRYSQENQTWQEHLEENYKATGTRTYFNEITDSNKKTLAPIHKETKKKISAPITRENNEINESRNTNRLIAKEQNTDNVKKKIIKAKVKTKKNNNGLKSARMAAKIAQNKMDLSNKEKNEFRKELMKYKGYTKEKLTNAKTYNEIKEIVKKYSDREISYLDREVADIKDYIKKTKLEVTQELKNSITDYNYFRKSNFGKLNLSNEGMSIDSLYEELSETYPGYFSNEIDTDEDRLYALSDFMNEDSMIVEKYSLDDKTIDDITSKVFNSLQQNAFSKEQIEEFEKEISDRMSKITRKSVRELMQKQMGITAEDLSVGKDINSFNYQLTDPIRVNEKVFGRELGDKINNETIRKTTHNEARKVRWLKSERNDIKQLGIKARSKESAAVQKYGEKQYLNKNGELSPYGDKELMAEFPDTKTQEKIKRAAEMIRNKYDKYINEINQSITSLGYDAIPKRKDYMRHFQELGDIFSKTGVPFNLNDMKAEDLPTDINGLTEFNKPGKNYFASAQRRIGEKTVYDAITGIDGYLEGAGNLIYHTADIQRYRALSSLIRDSFGSSKGFDNIGDLTDTQAEQRINDILDNKLSRYAAWLDEQANVLAGKKGAIDRGVERFLGRRVYTGLNTIKKQVGSNMTGFNVRSAMTNLISSTIASAKTNKIALIKGTVSTINNMFKNDGFIEKSDFLTTRFGSDQLSKKLWQKASNAGQIFMTGTDYFTANQITRSKYYEGLQKGMSESEAIKYADDFASRVMGDRSLGRTAEVFNSKTLGLLTQFQLEVNNQWQYMIHDTKMDYQENSEINGGLKAGATALFQMGQLAAFSYLFNELFETLTGSRAAFDPIEILKKLFEDDDDKPWDERISSANKELVDNIPFGNLLTGGGRIPISEAFKGMSTFGKKITGQKNQYGGDITWEDVKTDVLETLPYYVLPTGYGQIKKTTKGLSMFIKDKETTGSYTKGGDLRFPVKNTTANKIQAGLFGEYSSKNAREYFDNGYSAMGTNQQKMYKTLNIPISDYWEIRKEINSIKSELKGTDKSTEERKKIFYEYIDSLDVSNIKKSILKKSIYKSYDEADEEIKEYINSSKMSKQSKKDLLKELGLDD